MVRLRGTITDATGEYFIKFQFQNGAIERDANDRVLRQIKNFNSKMVRLRGSSFPEFQKFAEYFNSKMVRLRVPTINPATGEFARFQFQNGAIERMS